MKLAKLTVLLAALAIAVGNLAGCVVTPARAYVAAPAPVVVVHGYYRY